MTKSLEKLTSDESVDFPFRENKTGNNGVESSIVEWLREHSSYLTLGSLATKLGGVAAYFSGLLLNFSAILPLFLLFAIFLSYAHFFILEHPEWSILVFTLLFGLIINLVVLSVLVTSGISIQLVVWTRWSSLAYILGWFVLGFLLAIGTVFCSLSLEWMRDQVRVGRLSFWSILGLFFVTVIIAPQAIRLLPIRQSLKQVIQAVALATVGGLLVLGTQIWLTNCFIYGNPFQWLGVFTSTPPLHSIQEIYIFGLPLVAILLIGIIVFVSRLGNADRIGQTLSFLLLLVPATWLFVSTFNSTGYGNLLVKARKDIGFITRPLSSLTSRKLILELSEADTKITLDRLRLQREHLERLYEQQPTSQPVEDDPRSTLTPWAIDYFDHAQKYADDGFEFLSTERMRRFEFWQKISQLDRASLFDLARKRGCYKGDISSDPEVIRALASAIVYWKYLPKEKEGSDDYESVRDWLISSLSDKIFDNYKSYLYEIGPSALKQNEFARLLNRENELTDSTELVRRLSVFPGVIKYVADKTALRKIEIEAKFCNIDINSSIKQALLVNLLREIDTSLVPSLIRDPVVLNSISSVDNSLGKLIGYYAYFGTAPLVELIQLANDKPSNVTLERIEGYFSEDGIVLERSLLSELAVSELIRRVWTIKSTDAGFDLWLEQIGKLSTPSVEGKDADERMRNYSTPFAPRLKSSDLLNLAIAGLKPSTFEPDDFLTADRALTTFTSGMAVDYSSLPKGRYELFKLTEPIKLRVYLSLACLSGLFSFLFLDINKTAVHGFYRDRIASCFLLKYDLDGSTLLSCRHIRLSELNQQGSIAPYHLVNASINLQGSKDLKLRDQQADSFLFTKYFCGSTPTSYVETKSIEAADPNMNLATAMTISAAAASPNMGRFTNPFAVLLMSLLNVRLGYWLPNPRFISGRHFDFEEVFSFELLYQIIPRWKEIGDSRNLLKTKSAGIISASNDIIGLGFSGGGIRSAAFNLGVSQSLDRFGWFELVDYLSTVSGGGYTGSAISTAMSRHTPIQKRKLSLADAIEKRSFSIGNASQATVNVCLSPSEILFKEGKVPDVPSFGTNWKIPVANFGMEMISCLHENSAWINLSDGGHIENLSCIELLRRRCKLIILCDAEADPKHSFNGLGTLIRIARIELGVRIDLDTRKLRFHGQNDNNSLPICESHWAIGRIHFSQDEIGFLLYLKSSCTGDEPEDVVQYRCENPQFPQEPTSDQLFSTDQFEAYRVLGMHVVDSLISSISKKSKNALSGRIKMSPTAKDVIKAVEHLVCDQ